MTDQVKAVPEGFHTLTPHIVVRGGNQAIDFYTRALGAVEVMKMDGPDGKLMHAELRIGDSVLMVSDEFPEYGSKAPDPSAGTSVTLNLYVDDCDAVFNRAVESGASSKMAPADQFWGDRYGQFVDPFGHTWSVATHIKDLSEDEVRQGAAAAMSSGGGCSE
jgi:PhnB protein